MPYIGSSLKKLTNLFQISLSPYKMVRLTNFSTKKVCKVKKKEFLCFTLITVISPAKSRPYNVKSGKNCFYTFNFTKLYSGDWASIRLDRWSKAFVKNDFDLSKKILDAHPSCWYHLGSPHRYNVTSVFDFGPQFSCHSYKWEVIKTDQLSPGSFCFSVGWQSQVFLRVVVSKPNSKISNPSSVEFAWEPREDTGNSILLEHIPRGKNS